MANPGETLHNNNEEDERFWWRVQGTSPKEINEQRK